MLAHASRREHEDRRRDDGFDDREAGGGAYLYFRAMTARADRTHPPSRTTTVQPAAGPNTKLPARGVVVASRHGEPWR